jgi:opacity protein-like surface antigen
MTTRIASFVLLLSVLSSPAASAQSFDLSANFIAAQWSEFDDTDLGVGGRLAWKPVPLVGIEGDFNWYPSGYPDSRFGFSDYRFEGLAAVTIGPQMGRLRPFARAGVGFLKTARSEEPIVCPAIFPPLVGCQLALGATMPAFEIGGGLEYSTTARTFLRFDAAWRFLKYPGPSMTNNLESKPDGFWGGHLKLAFGGGIRF